MAKKTQPILLGLFILLLICSASVLYNHQYKVDHGTKLTVESIVGSSLFMIWSNYNSILENETDMLTIEHINDIHVKLSVIEAYSDTVGRSVNTQLLTPIGKDMKVITESMQKSYKENKKFTEQDQTKYATLINEITTLIPLIYKVYYVPESQEGAKVTLKVNNKEALIEFRDKLKNYVSNLNNV
ncbi:hypothetical protein Back11_15230 [Paenibacillus baekrokdamisoli]|uniref:Uncharacterized protein n=1 Tax=Paenibacillus baekrokdamisoli TaxID=1712516 RepID=A0A3G9J8L3_9BACL|nr:hypothetical protein [Paenibacillus baekrokdamisoli]MBB3072788.1 hypothetical protein [Paenibacillus baekrokdamisoli]BBH20178.1 hypothetical protein Back11_15230 [Paenibacillus baekrokdamisoli]